MADYLFSIVKTKVNCVDSVIVFRELKKDLLGYDKQDEEVEKIFGYTLHRKEESIENYNGMEMFCIDFIHNNINKYFNITIIDYLNLTRPERIRMNKVAKVKGEQEQKIIDDLKNQAKPKDHSNIMYDDLSYKG